MVLNQKKPCPKWIRNKLKRVLAFDDRGSNFNIIGCNYYGLCKLDAKHRDWSWGGFMMYPDSPVMEYIIDLKENVMWRNK